MFLLLLTLILISCRTSVGLSANEYRVEASDGEEIVYYELVAQGLPHARDQARAVIFYLQGSEYVSSVEKASMLASAVIFGAKVFMVEKRGCSAQGVDLEKAMAFSDKTTRVNDQITVMDHVLDTIKGPTPVILIGGSEGGDVAAVVAAKYERVTHLILIGSGGGMSQMDEFRYFVEQDPSYLNVGSIDALEDRFTQIWNGDDQQIWAGHTYKRWRSYLEDPAIHYLRSVDIPILLLHGSADRNVPARSAQRLDSAMQAIGGSDITYIEYEDLDHLFVNVKDGKSRYPYLEIDMIRWLRTKDVVTEEDADRFIRRVKMNHKDIF